jgi:serine/threonine protein kinase
MEAPRREPTPAAPATPRVDWESFYLNYRKPGYLPGFEIVNKLGGGMFGLVFKARKESRGKDYAIKFRKVDDDTVRDAVAREIEQVRFFAQIDHPNLVSIEDKGTVDGIPYLVMSYAGQDTLQKRLQQGGLSRDDALRIFVQAARGVQALHEHSLVHFDLKPGNIFLKGDVARVGDYGLSKLVSESRNSLSFGRGTPYYMAPEMLQRRGDSKSDIYSLGIILFECLYGDVPFRGDSEWEVLRKHETAEPQFPADALPSDREIVQRCLAKQPDERYASVAELLRALQAPVALGESMHWPRGAAPGVAREPAPGAPIPPPPAPPPAPPSVGVHRSPAPSAAPWPVDPPSLRDAADSPYGMPWQPSRRGMGVVEFAVRAIFTAIEAAVFVVLLPVRAVGAITVRGATWLFQFPFRVLEFVLRLIGLLVVAGLVLLVVVTLLSLFAAA